MSEAQQTESTQEEQTESVVTEKDLLKQLGQLNFQISSNAAGNVLFGWGFIALSVTSGLLLMLGGAIDPLFVATNLGSLGNVFALIIPFWGILHLPIGNQIATKLREDKQALLETNSTEQPELLKVTPRNPFWVHFWKLLFWGINLPVFGIAAFLFTAFVAAGLGAVSFAIFFASLFYYAVFFRLYWVFLLGARPVSRPPVKPRESSSGLFTSRDSDWTNNFSGGPSSYGSRRD